MIFLVLIEKEKEFEKFFLLLEDLSTSDQSNASENKFSELNAGLKILFSEWKSFLGNDRLSDLLKIFTSDITKNDPFRRQKSLKSLDFILSPLEYFFLSLEYYKSGSFRDSVTRCGMVVERITRKLWPVIVDVSTSMPLKVENRIGIIQRELNHRIFPDADFFCSVLRTIYGRRDRNGPHDAPAAEKTHAKLSNIEIVLNSYPTYLEILAKENIQVCDIEQMKEFCNFIVDLNIKVVAGTHGIGVSPNSLVLNLYQNGFFVSEKNLAEVLQELHLMNHHPNKSSILNSLNHYCRKRMLTRNGNKGNYTFIQRAPPEDFFS